MEQVSPALKTAVTESGVVATRIDVIQNGKVTAELDGEIDGSVTANRTSAQQRSLSLLVADPNGYIGQDTEPFYTRLQPFRGAKIQQTAYIRDRDDSLVTWAAGQHVGTYAAPTGALMFAR